MTKTKIIFIGPGLVFVLLVLVILVGMNSPGWLLGLLINGLVGVVILMLLNYLPQIEVPINIWTFLIAALGGILGVILLVLLNVMGVKDW